MSIFYFLTNFSMVCIGMPNWWYMTDLVTLVTICHQVFIIPLIFMTGNCELINWFINQISPFCILCYINEPNTNGKDCVMWTVHYRFAWKFVQLDPIDLWKIILNMCIRLISSCIFDSDYEGNRSDYNASCQ